MAVTIGSTAPTTAVGVPIAAAALSWLLGSVWDNFNRRWKIDWFLNQGLLRVAVVGAGWRIFV